MEELKHAFVVAEPQGCLSTALTEADLGLSSLLCLLFPGGAGDLAWRLRVGGVIMTDGTHKRPGQQDPLRWGA